MSALSKKSAKVQIALVVSLACVGGVGLAFTPVLMFVAIALAVVAGIWLYTRSSGYRVPRPAGYQSSIKSVLPSQGTESRGALTSKLTSIFLLIWWLTGLLAHGRVWSTGTQLDYSLLLQSAVEQQAQGILLNQLLVVSFGLVGMIFLVGALKQSSSTLRWAVALWLLYLCWGYFSTFWSIDPSATARRLVGYTLISLGSIGLGAGFYGNHPNGRSLFLRHVVIGGVLAALIFLLPLAFRWDQLNILDPTFILQSDSNTWSYVAYPALVALVVLIGSYVLELRRWRNYDWLLAGILLLAVLVLKTRGPALYVALALGIVYLLYRSRVHNRVFQFGVLVLLFIGVYVMYSERFLDSVLPYLTRGFSERQLYSLTGRIPLWEHLFSDVQQNPLAGVGFGAYWTSENLLQVNMTLSSIVPGVRFIVAHNGYIEELLATGIIGLALLLVFWGYVLYTGLRKGYQGDNFGWLTFLCALVYLLINLTQSLMQWYHHFFPFIVPLALIGLLGSARSVKNLEARKGSEVQGSRGMH